MGKGQMLGGPSVFLLLLFLLPGDTTTSTTEPQYLVLVPFLIHTETSEKICIQLSHLNESVTLSVLMEYGAENRSLFREVVSKKDEFKCVPFQLPRWDGSTGSSEVYLTAEVKGATLKFWSRKRVLVVNHESLTFVQTDRPIYKPGDKVQFRVVSLTTDFGPVNEQIPVIYIQDPKRNRLMQWLEVELVGGIVQLDFHLSKEPSLGTYKVMVQKASGKKVEHPFEMQEYVLPKFEVLVKAPEIITILAEEFKVTVCGMYTYGKAVPGLVKMRVCRKYTDSGRPHYYDSTSQCYGPESDAVCEEFSGESDSKGCFSQVVKTKVFQLKRMGYAMNIDVEGKIKEEGTEVELTGSASIAITQTLSTVTFERVDSYYKPGIPFFGQAKLVDGANVPIANKTVEIHAEPSGPKTNYTTDAQGRVQFSIDTANFTDDSIRIQTIYRSDPMCSQWNWLTPRHQAAYHSASRFYSPSQSYLHIEPAPGTLACSHIQQVRVHYVLKPDEKRLRRGTDGGEETDIVFHYVVMAKGNIMQSGTQVLPKEHRKAKGVFTLDLSVDVETAPLARLLLYAILPSGELVAHSADFAVENCFANKVKLWFPEPEGLPGSQTQLHVAAAKGSLCAIRAVDKSVFLLKPEAELSPQTVYDLLPVKDLRGYFYNHYYLDEHNINPCVEMKKIIVDGIRYSPEPYSYGEGDAYEILKDFGLKVFTSTKIHKPEICQHYSRGELNYDADVNSQGPPAVGMARLTTYAGASELSDRIGDIAPAAAQATPPVRSIFPETWLWIAVKLIDPLSDGNDFLYSSEKSGIVPAQATLPVTIPDTITEWQTGAFCLSQDVGIGLAPKIALRAFQPFFLEITLPYSVVRGEAFTLRATLFSYLPHCMRVHISLAPSPDFVAVSVEKEESSHCVCANGRKTVSWMVTPKSLGEVNFTTSAEALNQPCGNEIMETLTKGQKDTVIKQLLVEPEGIPKEVVFSNLLCAAEKPQLSTSVSLKLPENVVEGSARASFCVVGDILGPAIENLHQLLQMPYGCGEQNMALFAPNIYILDYLNKTGQLTDEIRSRAIGYLVAGYQRQLNYKHSDGSYSTFGQRSQETGNTWLTAFVLKSFAQAKRYIFVEEKQIQDAEASLAIRQKENGCFLSTGSLLNNALKGGVDDEITLSAYITIAFLEVPLPVTHSVVRNALFCLETASQKKDLHVYTRAVMAYAFALAGKEEKRQEMLHLLEEVAVKEEDDSLHWQQPGKPEEDTDRLTPWRRRAPSAEVEMAAYVLLAYLSKRPAPSQKDLATATRIVKWLSKQQNPTGGFASTQDTVVALQALTLYGATTYSKNSAGTEVTLSSGGNSVRKFQVNRANRLLLQCQALPKVPGDYDPAATGDGCVYIQTTLKYNEPLHQEDAPFALEVHTVPEACTGPKAQRTFDVAINVSYIGKRPASNMAIVSIKMLSGFIPVKSSVKKLESQNQVKRTEVSMSRVVVYLEQVTNVTQSLFFTVEQDIRVQHLKPSWGEVYDYYLPNEYARAEYRAPCSKAETS
ncbi:alpha-2-macroglobulin-like isoform X1 [Rhineura floridana]|uniref:alpha-2-macroglobulin-like isoform X1 n=1 Tax=Rhineura floridana TaxID=261503 RepID=UPI002AC865FF|nr:alpha-2-macroglobulin-like isoform X1 [Rhineura floridana]